MADDHEASEAPGTREELRLALEAAGMGQRQVAAWLDNPTAYLSGLVPALAITDPDTAARARKATRRVIARLGDPVPASVEVIGARILEAGAYKVELSFTWPDGSAIRHWDAEPYLAASRAHEGLLTDYAWFASLHIANRTLAWPPAEAGGQALDFTPESLFAESWPADTPGAVGAEQG